MTNETTKKIEQAAKDYSYKIFKEHKGSTFEKSFLAGAEFMDSLSESKQMKWIKGAPQKIGIYFCYVKWDEESELREVVTVGTHFYIPFYVVDGKIIKEEQVTEWLDESADQPNQQGCEEFAIGLKDWCANQQKQIKIAGDELGYNSDAIIQHYNLMIKQIDSLYISQSPQKTQTK